MSVVRIEDHVAQAADRVLSQSRRPRFLALLQAMTTLVQAAEDGIAPLQTQRFLSNAVGSRLDGIGELVNLPRNGLPDDTYRLFLLGKIYANSSDCTTTTITNLVRTLFDAKGVQVVSQSSAGFSHYRAPGVLGLEIGSPALPRALWAQAIELCKQSFAAAVRLSWVTVYDVDASFALAGPVDGQGLDGKATASGMAELIYQDQEA